MTLNPLDPRALTRHKRRNTIHTWLLVTGSVALLGWCSWLLWGFVGLLITAGTGLVGLWAAWRASPTMILKLYKARPLRQHEFPQGYDILRVLTRRADLPAVPTLHYIPSKMVNAFAVGRPDNAAVAVTDGMLRTLTLRELAGVLAHEVSHIRNEDVKVMALADVVSRMTSTMSTVGILAALLRLTGLIGAETLPWPAIFALILAPSIGGLIQLALSRAREYDADLDAAGLTGDPEGLASALLKLERIQGRMWESLALPGSRSPEPSVLRTHPRTEDRVERLLALRARAVPQFDIDDRATSFPGAVPATLRRPRMRASGLWY